MGERDSGPTYVAIDFETANESRDSACAVGIAVIEDGKVTRSFERLIRPPTDHFSEWAFRKHGIHWRDVAREDDFGTVWTAIQNQIGEPAFLVAHNAGFDQDVLATCCESSGIAPPDTEFVCTIEAASSVWTLDNYKLPRVCEFLGIPLSHHNAKSDAEAAATILLRALGHGYSLGDAPAEGVSAWAAKHLCAEIMELVASIMEDGHVAPEEVHAVATWLRANPEAGAVWPGVELGRRVGAILQDGVIDESELDEFRELCCALLGLRERKRARRAARKQPGSLSVCFTGFGPRKGRLRAEAEAAGFHVASGVTKTLDYLVCGPEPGPAKVEQARERGSKIMTADEWAAVVAGNACAPPSS